VVKRLNPVGAADDVVGPGPSMTVVDSLERLGLKLERRGVTVETVVVDYVSQPTEN
jgi:uncharacterized protein (TIGR03435 family)